MNFLKSPNNSFFKGLRVVVTGAGGHLGSQLVHHLLAHGANVSVLLRSSTDLWRLEGITKQLTIYHTDLEQFDIEDLAKKIGGVDVFYHLAAVGVNPNCQDASVMIRANVTGTHNALMLAQQLKVGRFIYCGSCFEYGAGELLSEDAWPTPVSEYGASKVAGWVLANTFGRKYGLPVVSLRPFTLYGPWESSYRLVSQVIYSCIDGKDIKLTDGAQGRDFIFIDDALEAFLNAATLEGIEGQTFNVGTGTSVTIKDMVALIMQLMQTKIEAQWGSLPNRLDELRIISANNPSKARAQLQWQACTTLEMGLQKTIDWVYANKRTIT